MKSLVGVCVLAVGGCLSTGEQVGGVVGKTVAAVVQEAVELVPGSDLARDAYEKARPKVSAALSERKRRKLMWRCADVLRPELIPECGGGGPLPTKTAREALPSLPGPAGSPEASPGEPASFSAECIAGKVFDMKELGVGKNAIADALDDVVEACR